jgi:hypothetical protein
MAGSNNPEQGGFSDDELALIKGLVEQEAAEVYPEVKGETLRVLNERFNEDQESWFRDKGNV